MKKIMVLALLGLSMFSMIGCGHDYRYVGTTKAILKDKQFVSGYTYPVTSRVLDENGMKHDEIEMHWEPDRYNVILEVNDGELVTDDNEDAYQLPIGSVVTMEEYERADGTLIYRVKNK